MGKLFEDLKEGFEDLIAHRKGKITLRTERFERSLRRNLVPEGTRLRREQNN